MALRIAHGTAGNVVSDSVSHSFLLSDWFVAPTCRKLRCRYRCVLDCSFESPLLLFDYCRSGQGLLPLAAARNAMTLSKPCARAARSSALSRVRPQSNSAMAAHSSKESMSILCLGELVRSSRWRKYAPKLGIPWTSCRLLSLIKGYLLQIKRRGVQGVPEHSFSVTPGVSHQFHPDIPHAVRLDLNCQRFHLFAPSCLRNSLFSPVIFPRGVVAV